jgi:hypothetical protein
MADTSHESIKSRIRKLMAMAAKSSGASKDEADTAMRLAMNLMVQHGIEQSEVGGEVAVAKAGVYKPKPFVKYRKDLAQAAGVLYGCKAIFYAGGKGGFRFVGRTDNIEAAEETLLWFIRQLGEFYRSTPLPPGVTPRSSESYQYNERFKWAAARRVWERAVELVANSEQIAASTGANALVVQGYFKTLQAENEEALKEMGVKYVPTKNPKYGVGTREGLIAGDRVKLRQEVGQTKQIGG